MILAIDPGTTESAWLLYDEASGVPVSFAKESNESILQDVLLPMKYETHELAIEMIKSYGMAVGDEVFLTCVWIGRFIDRWTQLGGTYKFVFRRDEKLHICESPKANDAAIRQALKDRYASNPEAIAGIKKDCWAALAVAITYAEANLDVTTRRLAQGV